MSLLVDAKTGVVSLSDGELLSELGISAYALRSKRLAEAITKPGTYLDERVAAIKKVGADSIEVYRGQLAKWVTLGHPQADAHNRAIRYADAFKQLNLQMVEEDFPDHIGGQAINRLQSTTTAASGVNPYGNTAPAARSRKVGTKKRRSKK
jgi:hypothetical protein